MLKKVLCMVLMALTVLGTLAVTNAGAKEVELEEVGKEDRKIYIMGDVNLDGRITVRDATAIQRFIAGTKELSEGQIFASDVNDDMRVNVKDVTAIQKHIAGIDYKECIGDEINVSEDVDENGMPSDDNVKHEPGEFTMTEIEEAVAKRFLELVNEERARVGAKPLKTHFALNDATLLRSRELAESFSHTRPNGTDCYTAIDNKGYFLSMGENVAYNAGLIHFMEYMDKEEIEKEIEYAAKFFFGQFKSSEGHYRNMINESFDSTGAGVYFDTHDGYTECYIAHMFGMEDNRYR